VPALGLPRRDPGGRPALETEPVALRSISRRLEGDRLARSRGRRFRTSPG